MKKQRRKKVLVIMTIIILAVSTLIEVVPSHQLNKIRLTNNQIEETEVGRADTEIQEDEEEGQIETSLPTNMPIESPTEVPMTTTQPTPVGTQIPTSSPITPIEETKKPEEEDKIKDENESTEDEPVIDESNGNEYISEDDLIYSDKYIVTENTIERINPKTTIEEFLSNITIKKGNFVKILKDGEEVTTGYMATGMKLQGSNGKIYEISVRGDITGDGIANQIELTMIVRHIVKQSGWNLEGVNFSAGDIMFDGQIDLVDVSKMINYIVYGKWDYEEIETPNSPTIRIITPKEETEEYYKNKVEIQIVEDKTTVNSKTTYKITGSKTQNETTVGEEEIITLEGEGTYLITAYTYGIKGNRSKGSNKIIKVKDSKYGYIVETYIMNLTRRI